MLRGVHNSRGVVSVNFQLKKKSKGNWLWGYQWRSSLSGKQKFENKLQFGQLFICKSQSTRLEPMLQFCTGGGIGAGHQWCPLRSRLETYEVDGVEVKYYYYAACCTGVQGNRLIVDPLAELPTCSVGTSASKCKRVHWHSKLFNDLLGKDSGYTLVQK